MKLVGSSARCCNVHFHEALPKRSSYPAYDVCTTWCNISKDLSLYRNISLINLGRLETISELVVLYHRAIHYNCSQIVDAYIEDIGEKEKEILHLQRTTHNPHETLTVSAFQTLTTSKTIASAVNPSSTVKIAVKTFDHRSHRSNPPHLRPCLASSFESPSTNNFELNLSTIKHPPLITPPTPQKSSTSSATVAAVTGENLVTIPKPSLHPLLQLFYSAVKRTQPSLILAQVWRPLTIDSLKQRGHSLSIQNSTQ
ncbi:hypothetical protein KIW84_015131 [Lathyrus oleraceus]|uniref:Uncharacterized protein n=1 Tax=Pisum sativum TaxID=3888 RepID=A0A9D5BPY0_PEA|nr:hypothetical protein KIW84_015131 [Pisum sativum]